MPSNFSDNILLSLYSLHMMVATRGQVMLIIEDPTAGADPGFPVYCLLLKGLLKILL
jgi:hypothetical protein